MDRRGLVRIGALSALILFLEMLLVRWIGTELRVFAYLQNSVLVAAFLGLGAGCNTSSSPIRCLPAATALAGIALVIRDPFGWAIAEALSQGLVVFQDSLIWGAVNLSSGHDVAYLKTALLTFSVMGTLLLLYAVAVSFHPLGRALGRWMDLHPRPIAAYTANVLGSLVGLVLFDAATVLATPPWVWLLAAGIGFAVAALHGDDGRPALVGSIVLFLVLPVLGTGRTAGRVVWSPYQKLSVEPFAGRSAAGPGTVPCGQLVLVNNVGYQGIFEMDPAKMARRPDVYPPDQIRMSHYLLPYAMVGQRDHVLVVGAGVGNDVTAALQSGARRVQAVEIDPGLVELGRQLHPDAPYASPAVSVAIDDARAFFRRDTGPYDLVWFGLLDSHTTPSAYTNVRLDHFVYTQESLGDVKRLLKPDGVLVLFFEPQASWIAERLLGMVRETFGADPLMMMVRPPTECLGFGGLLIVGGSAPVLDAVRTRVRADPATRRLLGEYEAGSIRTRPTTDDWPYLYLERPSIPRYHLTVAALCLVLALAFRRSLLPRPSPAGEAPPGPADASPSGGLDLMMLL
ncbi:MAG: hypothetical protein HY815_31065, partial [Candidatus Riflebacteria bacterium]|nr:hypothetical protein [Candidatus Riflebacteria bacterium]